MARILVVEDDSLVRSMLQQMLEREEHDVAVASDGAEALKALNKEQFELIVTDLIMPNMEGIEFIRSLYKQENKPKIIAISGGSPLLSPLTQLKSAKFLGANLTFTKPIDREEFVTAVRELVSQ